MRNILFLLFISLSFSSYSQEDTSGENEKNQVLSLNILKFQDTLNLILDYQL